MSGTKQPLSSVTIVGGIVTVILAILSLCGVGGIEGQSETVTQIVMASVTVVSGLAAIIGRIRATKQIQVKMLEKP